MELQDIVGRLRMKQSIKAIKRETGKHRRVIRRVLQLAEQEGWLEAERELPSEHKLQEVYHEHRDGEDGGRHPLDAHRDQIEGWRRESYSFLVIHQLLRQRGCVAPSSPRSLRRTPPSSRRPRSLRPHIRSPLHNQPPLRHPGSRCDIDSHPDCRPFLTLIVAPQAGLNWTLLADEIGHLSP